MCAQITYETSEPCQTYSLAQGCFEDSDCSGMIQVSNGEVLQSPSNQPSYTVLPTALPSLSASETIGYCPSYSASDTNSSLSHSVDCYISACAGASVVVSACSLSGGAGAAAGACSGDTYYRVYDSAGSEIAWNDDYCGYCSRVRFEASGACQTYRIAQGCYKSSACSATTSVTNAVVLGSSSFAPTLLPFDSASLVPSADVSPTQFGSCPAGTLPSSSCVCYMNFEVNGISISGPPASTADECISTCLSPPPGGLPPCVAMSFSTDTNTCTLYKEVNGLSSLLGGLQIHYVIYC